MPQNTVNTNKVALITGSAKRIGAAIAAHLHAHHWRVVIHYHHSKTEAETLAMDLNKKRPDSAIALFADFTQPSAYIPLLEKIISHWDQLDALINNAAVFIPTSVAEVTLDQWHTLFSTNLMAPFFLAQAAMPYLKKSHGSIVNITDTHADGRPIKNYSVYCMTKAALHMQTQSLARELAPDIRVNAIAPGVSLWEDSLTPVQQEILTRTPLQRAADAEEIAKAVYYVLNDATYTTGSVIYVDGGRCVFN